MDRKTPFLLIVCLLGISGKLDATDWWVDLSLECPSVCYCSKSPTDPSLLKTDCADKSYWITPIGVSKETTELVLMGNKLVSITRKYLSMTRKIKILDVSRNLIDHLTNGLFSDLMDMEVLDLSGNQLGFIKEGIFNGLSKLTTLYLGDNRISRLESRSLQGMPSLKHLWLHINRIWDLPHSVFHGLSQLKVLSLNMNKLSKLSAHLFRDARNLEFLFLQHNEITGIPHYFFGNSSSLRYVFMNNNNLTVIGPKTFMGAKKLDILTLSNNLDLADLEANSFNYDEFRNLSLIYILQTALVRIKMESFNKHKKVGIVISPTDKKYPLQTPDDKRLREGLERNGFECNGSVCTPCHFGTYQKWKNNSYVCEPCPAGGFYQNTVGHFGPLAGRTGCLPCPRGTFVELDKMPGKHQYVCRVCPAGSKTDEWSSYRGCFCIDSFYRKGRFTRCEACPKGVRGILCNETMLVKEGYWWKFRDYNESWEYQRFVDALMVPDEHYNPKDVDFTGEFPKAYPCPKAASCLGLHTSVRKPCQTGYGGPLCEVCEKGYHKSMSRCSKCPTLPWMITQVSLISCVIFILIFILVRDERKAQDKGRTLSDVVLARLKIVIGFYQVTAGTLDAFSYVQWPEALLQLSNYAKFVQLNLVQIAPLHCFRDSLKMDAYVGLMITVALNGGVIVLAFVFFQMKKAWIKLKKDMTEDEKHEEISYSKEHCYRSAFLVMFITFPEASSRILRMLPPACQEICQDTGMKDCTYYLKMDYSVKCFDKTYDKYVKAAYVGSVYPVLFPLFIVFMLYWFYYRPQIKNRDKNPEPKRYEIVEGMRFIYENYSERCWYWEIVETVRKLILTSGLALIGAEGRTYIGMAAMASGFYAVAHAQARPIPDKFEHLLQLASLVATFFNLSVGVLLRIPSEMVNYSIEKDKDSLGVTVLLVTANVMVTGLIVIRYLLSLGQSLYAVIKNPHCNWECCLSVILSVQDAGTNLTGVGGDIGNQDFKGKLAQGDDFAVPTMGSTVGDMGILDLGVENEGAEEDEGGDAGKEDDIEKKSTDSSGYDGGESQVGSSSPTASESPRPSTSNTPVDKGSIDGEPPVESGGSAVPATPNPDDPNEVPEVKFKKGGGKFPVDLPAAASNKGMDSDDVAVGGKTNEAVVLDILGPVGNEEHPNETERVPKGEAIGAKSNQALDDDGIEETGF